MIDAHLVIFGFGYTGAAVAGAAVAAGFAVSATSRAPHGADPAAGVRMVPFADAAAVIADATHVLATVPPPGDGGGDAGVDPVLDAYGDALAAAPRLRWAGYFSTTGVYGDRAGGWVDETALPAPTQDRSRRRLAAERAWSGLGAHIAVDLLRLAGIYGPGRSALDDLRAGRARRLLRPGHMFSRIHRDDIAAAALAAMRQERAAGVRVLNLADDEPAEAAAVIEEAARLLGIAPPEAIPYEQAEPRLSPMARSFWQESRLVASARTQAMLGLRWRYPSYRDGLRAILAGEQQHAAAQQGEILRP